MDDGQHKSHIMSMRSGPYQKKQEKQTFLSYLYFARPLTGLGRHMAGGSRVKNCHGDESTLGVSSTVISCPVKYIDQFHVCVS